MGIVHWFRPPCTWPTWPLTLHNSLLHGVVSGGCVTEAVKLASSPVLPPKIKIRGQGSWPLGVLPYWSSSGSRNT
ncbi:uncharacterized protein K444DRAFT_173736 [Hyaloscypha bicolor E]|uniref:Uncharacterized protein n=1 Tax=Hyaloscypha bicolor E TaxID=1095630 RepID=A0A2J6TQG8_9HELO|nr:uncharacterized protein K444DRAFT_173736 [Hyaloscypha bicolor E]PMD65198.1 hypothetical protein K444DRAFT_173736 [Hyaloscypha bicolor E]